MSNEDNVMMLNYFPQGLRFNATIDIKVLDILIKPWIKRVFFFFNMAHTIKEWLTENFHGHVIHNVWRSDLNPLDNYIWGVIERETYQ